MNLELHQMDPSGSPRSPTLEAQRDLQPSPGRWKRYLSMIRAEFDPPRERYPIDVIIETSFNDIFGVDRSPVYNFVLLSRRPQPHLLESLGFDIRHQHTAECDNETIGMECVPSIS